MSLGFFCIFFCALFAPSAALGGHFRLFCTTTAALTRSHICARCRRTPPYSISISIEHFVGWDLSRRNIGHLADSSLIAISAGRLRRVVCASPEYLKKRGVPKTPNDLLKHDCLRLTGIAPGAVWSFYSKGRALSVPVSGPFVCNQATATIEAVVDGLGVGTFLSYQVAPLVAQKKLKLILVGYEPPPIPLSIVYPHAKLLSARVRVFAEMATQSLRAKFD